MSFHPLHAAGMSLLELLFALVLMAVVLNIGLPLMMEHIERARLEASAHQLMAHLALARSHAISHGRWVTMAHNGEGWAGGWQVFEDADRNARKDEGERVLAAREAVPHLAIQGNGALSRYASFAPDGRPAQDNGGFLAGTLRLCGRKGDGLALVMNASGRVRMEPIPAPDCTAF